ncbi:hypothetical protein JZ751_013478, partial [Albula glossodonta]
MHHAGCRYVAHVQTQSLGRNHWPSPPRCISVDGSYAVLDCITVWACIRRPEMVGAALMHTFEQQPNTETTLAEPTEQHRITPKEEELSGLESVHMAEAQTECAAPGLNTQEPECVTAHSGVSDVHHTDASLIKTDTDLGSTHNGHLKSESLDHAELGYVTRLHPEQIKTEPDEGGYLNAERDIKCVSVQPEHIKSESSEGCVSVSVKPEHIKSESGEGCVSVSVKPEHIKSES